MFRRIAWEELLRDAQTTGLFLLGLAMVLLLARVLTTPKDEVKRLSEMPLNDE
ncbi:MAG: hypothetical protein RIS38_1251 [Verrucomicrobiota bacterium]|jgi:hypothetical protein